MHAPPAAEGSATALQGRSLRVTRLVVFTVFLDLVGFGIIIPLLPFYVQSMNGSASTVGALLSCYAFAQLLATPILGRVSDRFGRRRVMLISLAGNALSMLLFALATKLALLPVLFASRLLAGATAGNLAACQAAIADVSEGSARAKGMGRVGAGIGLGMVFGPVLGGTLSQLGSWAPPLGAAALAAADLLAAYVWMPETRFAQAAQRTESGRPRAAARLISLPLLVIMGISFCVFLGMTTLQVALALLTKLRFDWSAVEVGHVFGLFGMITLVVQGLLPNWLSKTFGELPMVTTGTLAAALGLSTIALAHAVPAMILGLVLLALGFGLTQPFLAAIAARYVGEQHFGAGLGLAQSAGGLARVTGPMLAGVAYERLSPAAPFLGGAGIALLAFLMSLSLRLISNPRN
jgi:MFS transporter, DHA1 family, tetracycline resistance protein